MYPELKLLASAMAISLMPSPLKSSITSEMGSESGVTEIGTCGRGTKGNEPGAHEVFFPSPRNTETEPDIAFVTATSGMPSPLRLPTATLSGSDPAGIETAGANRPFPRFLRIETVFEARSATTRSGRPSASKSPVAMDTGS